MHLRKSIRKRMDRLFGEKDERLSDKPNPIQPWDSDDDFNAIMEKVEKHTLVNKVRCFMIYQYARQAARLPGDVAEVGVYKGGTARLLAKVLESDGKTVHLFDTFAGMPSSDPDKDIHEEGDFDDTSFEKVKAYLDDCKNTRFYKGLFPETSMPVEDRTFSFVHVDVDIYQSVIDCCRFFYSRLQKGGIMVFDDYGFLTCPGAKMAVDEFFSDKPETPCYLPTGQSVVIRL